MCAKLSADFKTVSGAGMLSLVGSIPTRFRHNEIEALLTLGPRSLMSWRIKPAIFGDRLVNCGTNKIN